MSDRPQFSILVPFTPGCPVRERIHAWVMAYYRAHCPEAEVLTAGDTRADGRPLNRSEMRNRCAALATTDLFAVVDADCVLPIESLREAVSLVRQGAALVMYESVSWMSEAGTARLLATDPTASLAVTDTDLKVTASRRIQRGDTPLLGLAFILSRAAYVRAGGFDERFQGWGEEDPAFTAAVAGMVGPIRRLPVDALHLEHPRSSEHSHLTSLFQSNKRLANTYRTARTLPAMAAVIRPAVTAHRQLRITALSTDYLPGMPAGAEWTLHELLRALQGRGHAVEVLTPRPAGEMLDGIRTRALPARDADVALLLAGSNLLLGNHGALAQAIRCARQAKLPCVGMLHNDAACWGPQAAQCAEVLVNSQWVRDALGSGLVVHPRIDPRRYAGPGGRVLQIGLSENKGGSVFFALAARLPMLEFVGVMNAYEPQVFPPELPTNVALAQSRLDLRGLFALARVLLVPSAYESFGRVALEAVSQGIPVLASDCPGLREALGPRGTYLPARDVDAWQAALERLQNGPAYAKAAAEAHKRWTAIEVQQAAELDAVEARLQEIAYPVRVASPAPSLPVRPKETPPPPVPVEPAPRRVAVYASEPHFLDHLLPTWQALPEASRGPVVVPPGLADRARAIAGDAVVGVAGDAALRVLRNPALLPLTSSVRDLAVIDSLGKPSIFSEHGAGQSYGDDHPSYAGGTLHRGRVALFLVPNEQAARHVQQAHPRATVVVVGCPKLDAWLTAPKPMGDPPVVCLSWHWDCTVYPETRSAFRHYQDSLAAVLDQGWTVIGHAHPRMQGTVAPVYARLGIELVRDFADVVARADCYVCDNSSTLFEFAALDRPVVLCNAPWYRKQVRHGLRFWEAADIGIQVERASELPAAIREALRDIPAQRATRRARMTEVYAHLDGTAAEAAAAAILGLPARLESAPAPTKGVLTMTLMQVNIPEYYYQGKKLVKGQQFYANQGDVAMLTSRGSHTVPRCSVVDTPADAPREKVGIVEPETVTEQHGSVKLVKPRATREKVGA